MSTATLEGHVDVNTDVFARRLGNLVLATRRQRGLSRRVLANNPGGRFSRSELKRLEAGTLPLNVLIVERASEHYRADIGSILPLRMTVSVGDGIIITGGISTSFVAHNVTSLLTVYLTLVRSMRHQNNAPTVDLRRHDIDVLAAYLDEPGEAVIERLASLMVATRVRRTAMATLVASGAVVVGLVGAVAAAAPDTVVPDSVFAPRRTAEVVALPASPTVAEVAPAATVETGVTVESGTIVAAAPVFVPAPNEGPVVEAVDIPANTVGVPLASDPVVAVLTAGTGPRPVATPQTAPPSSFNPVTDTFTAAPVDDLSAIADQRFVRGDTVVNVDEPPLATDGPIVDVAPPPVTTLPGGVGEPPLDEPTAPVIDPSTVEVGPPPVPTTPEAATPEDTTVTTVP